ncbi:MULTISPECIES: glycine cleavage system protein R [unclassified Microbacterium]|uniref:glycine cleavage system protein R n=1 Tax=unclassified Microbacterium TaxID=2609290 RepID=UPI00214C54FB|nr:MULTISPECIES: ACT domain-containing protein [unclassified Microbacterium]MCR2800864.1 ACT domain-containing protein [Microbacterium sp. zg.Y818]MCR2827058.1 ACT domain-containing protein [Microbacterium sp. zg.Y909]WIM23578.1 ACT domain-containing protein [Microbacterium sp. zg-Y818]
MAHLVLTVVGDDRAGLVRALADIVAAHGGNWERSELAELAGAFAGVVMVSVPDAQEMALTSALRGLDGLLRVTAHAPVDAAASSADSGSRVTFSVLGNDRPGIVRDVTATLAALGLSIDMFTSATLDAPMAGGTLFEATVDARVPTGVEVATVVSALEELAGEIQVDITVGER